MNDYPTIIYDVIDLNKVRATIQNVVQIMVDAGAISEEKGKEVLANARYTNDLEEAVRDADFVQECVPERIELKRSVYRQIQEIRGADVIIASSTSATMHLFYRKMLCIPKQFWLDILIIRLICSR